MFEVGIGVPRLLSVRSSLGDHWEAGSDPGTNGRLRPGRTVYPGDRVVFTCCGQDPHGRELIWWLHPINRPRAQPVFGETVQLTWDVTEESIDPRAYIGIGMAGLPLSHRGSAPGQDGYDGWLLVSYTVAADPLGSVRPGSLSKTARR